MRSCLFFRPIKTISHCITICCPFSEKLVSHPGSATEVVFNYALCDIGVQLCTLQYWGSTLHFAVLLRFNYALYTFEVQPSYSVTGLSNGRVYFYWDIIAFIHQSFLRRLDFYGDTILIKVVVRYVLLYEVKTNCIAGCILLQSEAALFEPWPTTCLPSTWWPWSSSPLTPASTTAW